MPIEWALIYLAVIISAVYFSFRSGIRSGTHLAVEATLTRLHEVGLIDFEDDGTVVAGRGKHKFVEDIIDE